MIHYQNPRLATSLLEFQRRTKERQKNGSYKSAWATFYSERAFLRPLSGNESTKGQKNVAETTHRAYLTSHPDLKKTDRMITDGKVYEITYTHNPMNADRQLLVELKHLEGVNADVNEV